MRPVRLALLTLLTACATSLVDGGPVDPTAAPVGYDDTPRLPDGWRVHDVARPVPPPASARNTRDLLRPPPPGAVVLYDGTGLDAWLAEDGGPARWMPVGDGSLQVNGSGSIRTRQTFGDCELHLEWMTPPVAQGESQARGNSGVFLMGRYEVQILDSWRNTTYADGQAAALYGQRPPDVNASREPGCWQSYDIRFRAPRFAADGALLEPARATVRHNGVLVHDDVAFVGGTRHREVASYAAHEAQAPLMLQDHGDPLRFRNVWIRPLPAR